MPKTKSETPGAASSSSNSNSKPQNEKRKRKIGQSSKEKTNAVPSATVDEIVKRYSMQSNKSDKTEELSEECLAEISALEETFQELESFELQVEKIKDEVQTNPAENVGIGNDENQKHEEEKHSTSEEPLAKAEDQKMTEENSEKKHMEMDDPQEVGSAKKPRRSSRLSKA